jgi:hypothetical protein
MHYTIEVQNRPNVPSTDNSNVVSVAQRECFRGASMPARFLRCGCSKLITQDW